MVTEVTTEHQKNSQHSIKRSFFAQRAKKSLLKSQSPLRNTATQEILGETSWPEPLCTLADHVCNRNQEYTGIKPAGL